MPGGKIGNLIQACEYLGFKCKEKLCGSPLGQILNSTIAPVSGLSGGIIPPLCPPNAVNPADLAKPADSAAGAAARIKADEADAAARRAAVRYLATVDCHWWPEAQDALINALRADRNECVRWEAAVALGSGCCCTPKTIAAMTISVNGTDEDGNPAETSERVRGAAHASLQNCLSRFPVSAEPAPETPPEPIKEPKSGAGAKPAKTPVVPAAYYKQVQSKGLAPALVRARQSVASSPVAAVAVGASRPGGRGSPGLIGLMREAANLPPRTLTFSRPAVADELLSTPAAGAAASTPILEPIPEGKTPLSPTPAVTPSGSDKPAAPSPKGAGLSQSALPSGWAVEQVIAVLQRAEQPSHREWAARQLVRVEWQRHPDTVAALLNAAQYDPAPTVRATCVHSLQRMDVHTSSVVSALQSLTQDRDARVKLAAEKALARLDR
jgi:hypothetical protein